MLNKEDRDSLTNLLGNGKAIIIQIRSGASGIMTKAKVLVGSFILILHFGMGSLIENELVQFPVIEQESQHH